MLSKAAEHHRKMFIRMLESAGESIIIRQPPDKTTSTSASGSVFGDPETPDEYGSSDTVVAMVSDVLAGATSFPEATTFPSGILAESDVVLRIYLEDILLDPDKPRGRTIVDNAKTIEVGGELFEMVGRPARTGLPPLGPYIYWAGLRKLD